MQFKDVTFVDSNVKYHDHDMVDISTVIYMATVTTCTVALTNILKAIIALFKLHGYVI